MSVPDPITILHSILLLIDYGNQLAGAGNEMIGYCKMIEKTSDLVKDIRIKLTTLGHLLNDREMDKILRDLKEADEELKSAFGLVVRIKKRRAQWSKNVRWVFRNKSAAQTYRDAIAQCQSTLKDINMQLVIMGLIAPRVCSGHIPDPCQHAASPDQRALDGLSCRSTHRKAKTFPVRKWSSFSHLRTSRTFHPSLKTQEPELEINMWLLKRAKLGSW